MDTISITPFAPTRARCSEVQSGAVGLVTPGSGDAAPEAEADGASVSPGPLVGPGLQLLTDSPLYLAWVTSHYSDLVACAEREGRVPSTGRSAYYGALYAQARTDVDAGHRPSHGVMESHCPGWQRFLPGEEHVSLQAPPRGERSDSVRGGWEALGSGEADAHAGGRGEGAASPAPGDSRAILDTPTALTEAAPEIEPLAGQYADLTVPAMPGVAGKKRRRRGRGQRAGGKARVPTYRPPVLPVPTAQDDPATVLIMPGVSRVPGDDVELESCGWLPPQKLRTERGRRVATLRLSYAEYLLWFAGLWAWASSRLAWTATESRSVLQFVRSRAEAVRHCTKHWRVPKCRACGHVHTRRAYPVDRCRSHGCPVCARRAAQHWRRALLHYLHGTEAAKKARRAAGLPRQRRDFYLYTFTLPVRVLSLDGIRADYRRLVEGIKTAWRTELRFLPAGEDGTRGVCEEAGLLRAVEMGPSGNLHCHCLYYGTRQDVSAVRAAYQRVCPDATHGCNVEYIKRGRNGRGVVSGISEVAKYLAKLSVVAGEDPGATGSYSHPMLQVLTEIALYRCKRFQGYGTMSGLIKAVEDAEEHEGADDEKGLGPCPCCQADDWEWQDVTSYRPWVPAGWGARRRSRAGPGAGPPVDVDKLELPF